MGIFSFSQHRKIPRKKIPRNCCAPGASRGNKSWECASQKNSKTGKTPPVLHGDQNPGIPKFLGWFCPRGIPNTPPKETGSREVGSLWKLPWEFQPWIQAGKSLDLVILGDFFPCFFEFQRHQGFSLTPKKSRRKTPHPQSPKIPGISRSFGVFQEIQDQDFHGEKKRKIQIFGNGTKKLIPGMNS